jgi:putative membrane protein insertion efficiency factor
LRLETYLSTQPPAPGKNTRLSYSYEHSGGAQCVAAPPSEEPPSLDSIKRSFDLSSLPQDFSAATPRRVSAGIRRRAAPQRITMHGLLPAQRATTLTLGDHHASPFGECGAAQSSAPADPRSVSSESAEPARRLGLAGKSSRSGGQRLICHSPEGVASHVSPATTGIGYRGQVPGHREQVTACNESEYAKPQTVPCNLSPVTFSVLLKYLALGLIRFYQACLSPVMPSACRFHPSCSAYAFEAVEKWGVIKGGRLALGRLLRCRPWSGSFGYDPVPEIEGTGYREQVTE